MINSTHQWRSAVYAVLLSASAQASAQHDPADARTAVPVLKYESVFAGYQRFEEQKGSSWQEVNKEVANNPGMGMTDMKKGPHGMSMPGMAHGDPPKGETK